MPDQPSISLVSRLVILSSIAYYGLDTPLVTDAVFDAWCKRIHDEWDDLDPLTQWKLGDPQSIHNSGFHIKCSDADLGGLTAWLKSKNMLRWRLAVRPGDWKIKRTGKARSFRYCNVGDVVWDKKHPVS